jgi:hypothetical protein
MVSSPRFRIVRGTAGSDQLAEGGCASSTTKSAAIAPARRSTQLSTMLSFVCWAGVGIRARKAMERSAATTVAKYRAARDGRTLRCCNSTCDGMSDTVLGERTLRITHLTTLSKLSLSARSEASAAPPLIYRSSLVFAPWSRFCSRTVSNVRYTLHCGMSKK